MDIIAVFVALITLMLLTMKKVPVPIATILSVILMALLSGVDVLTTITGDYMTGMADFLKSMYLMVVLGMLFGRIMELSGCAISISRVIVDKLGPKMAILSILLVGTLLTYGGIASMVACFALYPIAVTIFRRAGIPKTLLPGVIAAAIFTTGLVLPGSPQGQNIIPTIFLGTSTMAAPVLGIVAGLTIFAINWAYFEWQAKKAKKQGVGFEVDETSRKVLEQAERAEANGSIPNPIIAILPIVGICVTMNVFKWEVPVALLFGTALCLIPGYKAVKETGFLSILGEIAKGSSGMIITMSSIIGLGTAMKAMPGFQKVVAFILETAGAGGNALVIFGIATAILCGLNASGTSGMSIALSTFAEPFGKLGVSLDAMHRICTIASTSLDSLPHSGGVIATLEIAGVSYKDGYKHVFVGTVVNTLIGLAVALVVAQFMYPM